MVLYVLKIDNQIRDFVAFQSDLGHLRMAVRNAFGKSFLKVRHRITGPQVPQRRRGGARTLPRGSDGVAGCTAAFYKRLPPSDGGEIQRFHRIVSRCFRSA